MEGISFITIILWWARKHLSTILHLHASTKWGHGTQKSSLIECSSCTSFSSTPTFENLGGTYSNYLLSHKSFAITNTIRANPIWKTSQKPLLYSHIRVYTCLCYATNLNTYHKFDIRARRYLFLGYPLGHKAYHVYDLDKKTMFTSWDVTFHKNIFPYSTIPNYEPY